MASAENVGPIEGSGAPVGHASVKTAPGFHVATPTCMRKPVAHAFGTSTLAPSEHAASGTGVLTPGLGAWLAPAALLAHMAHALHMQNPQSNWRSAAAHHGSHDGKDESPGLGEEQAALTGAGAGAARAVQKNAQLWRRQPNGRRSMKSGPAAREDRIIDRVACVCGFVRRGL